MHVLLADDDPNVCSALSLMLKQELNVTIGEVNNSNDLLAMIKSESPDLVLLDWELPGCDLDLISHMNANRPGLAVLVLSSRPDARKSAITAGADNFVSKGDPPENLLAAIRKYKKSPKRFID